MGFFSEMAGQISDLYARLTTSQKIAFVLLVALVVVFMTWFTDWGARADYIALTAQPADEAERSAALNRLQQAGIDVRDQDGVLEVARPQLSRAMAMLADAGVLPSNFSMLQRDGSKSYSMFRMPEDSIFERGVLRQEFLGEIIRHMAGIRMAKVVFDVPPSYARVSQDRKGTASVVVWLKDKGARLSRQQVEGIASLVSGALHDIPKENVRIIDGQGHPYRVRGSDDVSGLVAERHEQELMYEELQARKVQNLLSYLGQVKVFIDYEMDFNQKSIHTREVNPDKVADTMVSSRNSDTGTPDGKTRSEREKRVETEVTTTEIHLQKAPGTILDVSVTVLVPREGIIEQLIRKGVAVDDKASGEDLAPELDETRICIANALGMEDDAKVVVKAVTFPRSPLPELVPEPERLASLWTAYGTSAVLGLLTLIAMLLLWRMLKRPVEVKLAPPGVDSLGLHTRDEDLLADLSGLDSETARKAKIERRVREMVQDSPQEAAEMITRWVRTES